MRRIEWTHEFKSKTISSAKIPLSPANLVVQLLLGRDSILNGLDMGNLCLAQEAPSLSTRSCVFGIDGNPQTLRFATSIGADLWSRILSSDHCAETCGQRHQEREIFKIHSSYKHLPLQSRSLYDFISRDTNLCSWISTGNSKGQITSHM